MAEIFRKSALEKLSSPEQLDKMIVITSPSFWLSMVGAGIVSILKANKLQAHLAKLQEMR